LPIELRVPLATLPAPPTILEQLPLAVLLLPLPTNELLPEALVLVPPVILPTLISPADKVLVVKLLLALTLVADKSPIDKLLVVVLP